VGAFVAGIIGFGYLRFQRGIGWLPMALSRTAPISAL
jgi:hypothetical protein